VTCPVPEPPQSAARGCRSDFLRSAGTWCREPLGQGLSMKIFVGEVIDSEDGRVWRWELSTEA
jgi:hypothetical protein